MAGDSKDTLLKLQKMTSFAELSKVPCETRDRATKFVTFACRCVQNTPVGTGLTP